MKYAILLEERLNFDAPKIEEYCAVSAFKVDETIVFEDFSLFCRRLKSGDSVVTASVVTLGKRFEDIIHNLKLLAEREAILYCVKEQILINTTLPQTADKLLNICLKLYKGMMSFRNKSIQENLLKAGRPRGAPSHRQAEFVARHAEIMALKKEGKNTLQIAKLLGCSHSSLYRYMKKHPELQNG